MQSASQYDTPEDASSRARYDAQMQAAMNDLCTYSTRNSLAYTAQTDDRGRAVTSNPLQDDQMVAQHHRRQAHLQSSGNEATRIWNTPNNFDSNGQQELSDRFGGQSHRQQEFSHVAATVPAGPSTIPRVRTGPSTRPAAVNPVPAFSSARPRASSPTARGTIRIVNGQREELPLPARHRSNGDAGLSNGTASRSSNQATHQSVSGLSTQAAHQPVSKQATRQPVSKQTASQPMFDPLDQAVRQFAWDPFTPPAQQPATHVVSQATQQPAPQVVQRAIQQPATHFQAPGIVQRDQSRVDMIFDAIGTHRLIILMGHSYQDGAEVTRSKVHVRECATQRSEPDNMVQVRGLQWVAIFHRLRKDLVSRAIEIEYMPQEHQPKQLEITSDTYYKFRDRVYQDVVEARTVVAKNFHHDPYFQDLWKSAGKKDVLDRVIEKETVLYHERVNQRAMRRRESISRLLDSESEADMTIKVVTTVDQTVERIDPEEAAAQPPGVSTTTISGPPRKTVHFNPGVGELRICDQHGDEFSMAKLGVKKGERYVKLPIGVAATLAITIDHREEPSERVKDYLAALQAVADVLFRAEEGEGEHLSESSDSSL